MSEIKGQLLGIFLVVAVFGAVAGVLLNAFNQAAAKSYQKVANDTTIVSAQPADIVDANHGALTF